VFANSCARPLRTAITLASGLSRSQMSAPGIPPPSPPQLPPHDQEALHATPQEHPTRQNDPHTPLMHADEPPQHQPQQPPSQLQSASTSDKQNGRFATGTGGEQELNPGTSVPQAHFHDVRQYQTPPMQTDMAQPHDASGGKETLQSPPPVMRIDQMQPQHYSPAMPPAVSSAPYSGQVKFSNFSLRVHCHYCHRDTDTVVKSDSLTLVNLVLGFCFCLWCAFCIPGTARHTHSCEHCGRLLGSNNIS
jgi:LITAF-like zinc ribbon domain